MIKIAINGFGRIGRIALRLALTRYLTKVKVVAVNTSGSMDVNGWAHLFEYDSVYGRFKGKIETKEAEGEEIGFLIINHQRIPFLAQREPAKIPWQKYQVEVVIEATGVFREKKLAAGHLRAGAKKVVISAPAREVKTFLLGLNEKEYQGEKIIDMASCTTNCIAPLTKVMMENFGLQKALMTTIHANTADQELVDGSHRDWRRGRAALVNIVPTSTGAARATTKLLPSLQGLFDGLAYRVPIICGSVVDAVFLTTKRASVEEVNQAFLKAAAGEYKGLIATSDKPLVSTDIIGSSVSATVDLNLTQVIDGDLVKVVAWYDNEWGYCCRLIELVAKIGAFSS